MLTYDILTQVEIKHYYFGAGVLGECKLGSFKGNNGNWTKVRVNI